MAKFTLDDIRAAAEKKYGHTDIMIPEFGEVRLLNAMQLPKEKRDLLGKAQESVEGEEQSEQDELASFHRVIRIVARSEHEANALINAVGDNLAFMAEVFDAYNKGTELGEA